LCKKTVFLIFHLMTKKMRSLTCIESVHMVQPIHKDKWSERLNNCCLTPIQQFGQSLIYLLKLLMLCHLFTFAYDFCQQLSISCSLNQSADRVIDVTVKWHTFLITVFVLICSFKNKRVLYYSVLRFKDLDYLFGIFKPFFIKMHGG
jgi:hypothetical protein